MALRISLENEEGYEVASIGETDLLRPLIPSLDDEQFELLGYIDPYGNTIFNRGQSVTLVDELKRMKSRAKDSEAVQLLDQLIQLADHCAVSEGLYLKFYGE